MDWLLTFFAVHVVAMIGCVRMYRGAVCWMQATFMGMLSLAMAIMSIAYLVAMIDGDFRPIVHLAMAIEHIGILIYLFRLNVQGMQWTESSGRSRSSPA